jgi:GDP-L-fucose synthase
MPTNLYGTFDNFSLTSSHVLPALIRRFHDAKVKNENQVILWGTGKPQRELMEVDDFARALTLVINNYDEEETINIGVGIDQTISDIALITKNVVGFRGEIVWDESKPDGTPKKLLDISKLKRLGFEPELNLKEGVAQTYKWFLEQLKLKNPDLRL